jgi:hypothetical protein
MKKLAILLFTFTLFASAIIAQKPPKISNPGVTAEFAACGANDLVCLSGNRVRQDLAGNPFTDGLNGVSAVFNLGSGSRDLTINLITSQRSVVFDFSVVTDAGTTPPAWILSAPVQAVKPSINVLGAHNAKELCGSAAACNINYQTRMNAGLWKADGYTSVTHALLWNPAASGRPVNAPQPSVPVNVNYVKDATGEVFVITPIPNNAGQSIAGLESSSRKSATSAGQYDMPFTLTVKFK